MASVHQGIPAAHAVTPRQDGVVDQQDGVLGGHAHQHDQADQAGHGEGTLGQEQGHKGTTQRQGQGRQDGDGLSHPFEQEHQHQIDAQHAGQHGQAKAGEQLHHDLGIAQLGLPHAGRQLLQRGQLLDHLGGIAQRNAIELRFKVDVALAVITVNLSRSVFQGERRHIGQHHRLPTFAGHRHLAQQGQVLTRRLGQPHHNGHLALRQVQLGQARVIVAAGGHAQGVGHGLAADTGIGRTRKVGAHHQLRAAQACRRSDIAQARHRAQVALHRTGSFQQAVAVVA